MTAPGPLTPLSVEQKLRQLVNDLARAQVVLREARGILGTPPAALAPGERRSFEISFDHVPPSWNMQLPAVRVTSLRLAKAN